MTLERHTPPRPFRWRHVLLHVGLIIGSLIMLLPFLWMLSTSLKEQREIFTYPPTWIPDPLAWGNYEEALTAMPFDRFYFNSVFVACAVTFIQILTSSLAAFRPWTQVAMTCWPAL